MLARRTKGTIVFVRAKKCFRKFKRSETGSQVCFRVEQSIPIFPETPFSPIFPSSINNNKKERGREKKKPFSQESTFTHGNKQRGNITLHLSTLRYYSEPPSLAWPTLFLSPLALHFPRVSFQLTTQPILYFEKRLELLSRPEILLAFDKNSPLFIQRYLE